MKAVLSIIYSLLFAMPLNAAEGLSHKSAMLVISSGIDTAEGRGAVEKLKSGLAAHGVIVTEISVDEAQDLGQAGLIADGGPVITMESQTGKLEFKVHDGISGADITKTFNATSMSLKSEVKAEPKKEPEPVVVVKTESVEQPKPVERSAVQHAPRETAAFSRNHMGLSAGPSNFAKNKDSLEMLQQNNALL